MATDPRFAHLSPADQALVDQADARDREIRDMVDWDAVLDIMSEGTLEDATGGSEDIIGVMTATPSDHHR